MWLLINPFVLADHQGVSRELSLHPVHLTPDKEGNLPPSALVPFCSYQGDSSNLGNQRPELGNLTMCDKFEPTVLEGQLCYSLDVAKLGRKPTRPGREQGLFLLLDPKPYHWNYNERARESKTKENSFKLLVHSLAQFTTFGPGSYGMTSLKRMTHTKSFEQLPETQKKCIAHNRETCQTQKYLEQVEKECRCVPWDLANEQTRNKVGGNFKVIYFISLSHLFQEISFCGPEKKDCVISQFLNNKSCRVPCDGLYADIDGLYADIDSLKEDLGSLKQDLVKGRVSKK